MTVNLTSLGTVLADIVNDTGSHVPSDSDVANYDAAFSWGNHADAGYLLPTDVDGRVIEVVKTIADIKSADVEPGIIALDSIGRGGLFKWTTGDLSAEVAADTLNGVYVKADAVASTSGAWVRVFSGPLIASWFGLSPHGLETDVVTDTSATLQAITDFAAEYFHHIMFQPGHYYFNKWSLKRGINYEGLGTVGNARTGVTTGSEYDDMLVSDVGAVFIAMGNDFNAITIEGVTSGAQCGYERVFSTATAGSEGYDDIHPNATTPFTKAQMFDATNKDASGTTKATLKTLKCAVVLEDSWEAVQINNLRFVSSNATTDDPQDSLGDHYGLSGYADSAVVYAIPDYDIGFFYRNAWQVKLRGMQVIGYWRGVGTMCFLPPADGFTSVTANSEQGKIENCAFQSGISFRCGDLWPVVDVDGNDVYIRWTASHRFDTSGVVNISNGDTFNNSDEYAYSALSYSTSATPNTAKTGEFLVFTLADATGINAGDKIEIHTGQGGISHTRVDHCRIAGVDHLTGLDQSSDELAPYFDRYIPAFEISGAPMRALQFTKCVFNTMSPVIGHVGAARDLEFWGCYAEGKSFKWTLAGSLESHRGGVFIAGPSSIGDYAAEAGNAASAQIYIEVGRPWNSTVSIAPYYEPRAGRRLSTMVDVFNPKLARLDAWIQEPGDLAYTINLMANQQMLIESRDANYDLTQMFRIWQASGSHILDLGDDGTGTHQLRLRSNGTIEFTGDVTFSGNVDMTGSLLVDGNQVVDPAGGIMHRGVTEADLNNASSAVNTLYKREGLTVSANDTNKKYTAIGSSPTSTWAEDDGATNITPA